MVLTVIPMFVVLGLPMTVTQPTKDFYNHIMALKKGDVVLVGVMQETAGGWIVARDATKAIFSTLCERGAKMIFINLGVASPGDSEYTVDFTNFAKYGYKYGEDYVLSPFIAGEETAMAKVAADMWAAFPKDLYGNDVSTLPLMQRVRSLADVNLILIRYCKFEAPSMYVRQWASVAWDRYKIPTISTLLGTLITPWYGVYIHGNLDETRGYAEFEYLSGKGGEELFRIEARNLITYAGMALIVAGLAETRLKERSKIKAEERAK
jgi:hypothetical protein